MNDLKMKRIESKISINNLILLAIKKENNNCNFEKILEIIFKMSPQSISFKKNKWPDSRKIDRPLRSLKKEMLIKENLESIYSLTKKGEKEITEINKSFYQIKLL